MAEQMETETDSMWWSGSVMLFPMRLGTVHGMLHINILVYSQVT